MKANASEDEEETQEVMKLHLDTRATELLTSMLEKGEKQTWKHN